MSNNLQNILTDLFAIDPELKGQEEMLKKIIAELVAQKPDIQLDAKFVSDLKTKLLAENTSPIKFSLFNNNMTKVLLAVSGGALVLLAIFAVMKMGPNLPGNVAVNTNMTTQQTTGQTSGVAGSQNPTTSPSQKVAVKGVTKFASADDFKKYLALAPSANSGFGMGGGVATRMNALATPNSASEKSVVAPSAPQAATGAADSSGRFSGTNVQVVGIDEPDMVKTDGSSIFFSTEQFYPIMYNLRGGSGGIMAPNYYPYQNPGVSQIIKATPPSGMKTQGKIPLSGNLLYKNNTLMVLSGNTIHGYDVADKANPKEQWKIDLGDRNSLIGARLYNDKLYVATAETINFTQPCPIQPLTYGALKLSIPCGEIYHPISPAPTDVVYTVSSFEITKGGILSHVSFTGSSSQSVLYMSQNNIYLTNVYPGDMVKFTFNFLNANKDIVPSVVLDKLAKLQTYDISDSSKQNELYNIMNGWLGNLNSDDQLRLNNELQNRISNYYPQHQRELEQTSIVRVNVGDLTITGTGSVPGTPLNQFSLDEFQGNLRIAVTVGSNFWGIANVSATTQSTNDVYVLGSDMSTIGSLLNLGQGEQIYSARFIGDRGYVVTFKQTDPFHVLDLSDAKHPVLAGELKVPGYSGYLEPIGDHVILGVGQENSKVKAALYDVSDPKNPTELSKYILNEYWSAALSDHHAFLKDDKHQVFFIPGGQGGYVFSFAGNKLSLAKAVSDTSIQRALYINDALYIIGSNKITVWDENSWNKLGEFSFDTSAKPTPGPIPYDSTGGSSGSGTVSPGVEIAPPVMQKSIP